jgi:hypothetical protein
MAPSPRDDHDQQVTPDVRAPPRSWSLPFLGPRATKAVTRRLCYPLLRVPQTAEIIFFRTFTVACSSVAAAVMRICLFRATLRQKLLGKMYVRLYFAALHLYLPRRLRFGLVSGLVEVPAGTYRSAVSCSAARRKKP